MIVLMDLLAELLGGGGASLFQVLAILLIVLVILAFQSPGSGAAKELDIGVFSESAGQLSTSQDATESFCRSLGAPDHPHEEGVVAPAHPMCFNNTEPSPFQNEICDGFFLSLHQATYSKELSKSGNYAFGDYFLGKKRIWELRWQFRFKRPPPRAQEVFFGIELENYVPMNRATKKTMETIVSMLRRVVGSQVYHSPGDNPEAVRGPLERPAFVMPLWALDQYIVTPEGERPPDLAGASLPSMGSKRAKRVRQYRQELDQLEFKVGPTYTFCFWGVSTWIDRLNWEIKMPFMRPIDFNLFCGGPPVHSVFYVLTSTPGESRHLQSRKEYIFDVAFWSSKCRPSQGRIEALLRKEATHDEEPAANAIDSLDALGKVLTRRTTAVSWLGCCGGRS